MRLADLKLNPDNPRNISEEKLDKLAESIKSFPKMMVKRPIVYDENKVIIGGNMRYRAIQKLGMSEIPDEWTSDASDFTPEERHRFIMQDNAEMGVTDWDMVANQYELEDLDAWGIEVPYADTNEEVEEDEAPEVDESEPPKSKLGEIYQLGRHRVMCGDSTDFGAVSDLMDGKQADMVFTDPPYGMGLDTNYSGIKGSSKAMGKGIKGKSYDKVIGDDAEFDPTPYLDLAPEVFMWGGDYYAKLLPMGGWFVWDKCVTKEGVVSEGAENMIGSTFELCWSKKKHKRMIVRMFHRGFTSIDSSERQHPTQKPIQLASWFINKFSKSGNLILDLFLGSGSTLVACEQTQRTCYGMELDPKYVDVIRKRYWKFTHHNNEEGWEDNTKAVD